MYKKIVTVVQVKAPSPSGISLYAHVAVYISSKLVWSGLKKEFTGFVVLNLVENVKSYFEIRYKDADRFWFANDVEWNWPESLKEVKYA